MAEITTTAPCTFTLTSSFIWLWFSPLLTSATTHYRTGASVISRPELGSLFIIPLPNQLTFDHERNIVKEE